MILKGGLKKYLIYEYIYLFMYHLFFDFPAKWGPTFYLKL